MPAYPDFHLHSEASFDGQAPLSAMWQAAQARGLPAVAVTDHVEMTMFEQEHFADAAAASAAAAQELQARIGTQAPRLALGLELGEPLDDLPATQALLRRYPYDFVLGSLHNLSDGLDYYYYDYSDFTEKYIDPDILTPEIEVKSTLTDVVLTAGWRF